MPFCKPVKIGNKTFDSKNGPYILGVVNVSPESPNQSSVCRTSEEALKMAHHLRMQGADIIDVGGVSTDPGVPFVSEEVERKRLVSTIQLLVREGFLVSVDSWRPQVIAACLDAGANLINDTSGLQEAETIKLAAQFHVPMLAVFIRKENPRSSRKDLNAVSEMEIIVSHFSNHISLARDCNIDLILDPGTGLLPVGRSAEEKIKIRLSIYHDLEKLQTLGYPICVDVPYKVERPTAAMLASFLVHQQVDFLRTHDVSLVTEVLKIFGKGKWV